MFGITVTTTTKPEENIMELRARFLVTEKEKEGNKEATGKHFQELNITPAG